MFCEENPAPDATAAASLAKPGVREALAAVAGIFESAATLDHAATEPALRTLSDERKLKFKDLMQGVRAAITGGTVSPPLFDMIGILGKERTVRRIRGTSNA